MHGGNENESQKVEVFKLPDGNLSHDEARDHRGGPTRDLLQRIWGPPRPLWSGPKTR
jgi:hypothetical protein